MAKAEKPAALDFRGDNKEILSSFPLSVKATFGFNLRRLQNGESAVCVIRSMPSVGSGVFELKEQDERTWYRVMYLAKVMDEIYVLHCFEKNTNKTSRRDLDIAKARLKEVNAEIREKRARLKKERPHGSH